MEKHTYHIPDYVLAFSCKQGRCRHACCQGWAVSITLQNYFDLLSLECGPDLRRRLDGGMHMADAPSPDHYAQFSPRYDGKCPLRMEDGLCALHAEIGEHVLPDICRLYPRGIRYGKERMDLSLAGSCEGVLELFCHRPEPLTFIESTLAVKPPQLEPRQAVFQTLGMEWEIRLYFMKIMQNREISLAERLLFLGRQMQKVDGAMAAGDGTALAQLLTGEKPVPTGAESGGSELSEEEHLTSGLWIAKKLTSLLDARHHSIHDYGEKALAYFGNDDGSLARYQQAKEHLETAFPQWETFYEHMMVNHMFFTQFPFQDRPESLPQEYTALCAVYMLLRFLTIGAMAESDAEEDLIDVCAALFRLIEHTEFDRYAGLMLKSVGCGSAAEMENILKL